MMEPEIIYVDSYRRVCVVGENIYLLQFSGAYWHVYELKRSETAFLITNTKWVDNAISQLMALHPDT